MDRDHMVARHRETVYLSFPSWCIFYPDAYRHHGHRAILATPTFGKSSPPDTADCVSSYYRAEWIR